MPVLLVLLGLLLGPAAAAAATPLCDAPAELLEPESGLPGAARAIAGGELRVLVLGSATVLAPGGSGTGAAWPARLEALLRARYPNLRVTLTVHGGRGLTAADQLGILAAELPHLRPHLLIWQTGTVEATRSLEPEAMTQALNQGLDLLRAAGGEAVLMDPQFSRFLRANADVEPYREALRLVGAAQAAPLFRRFELMRLWAETDRIDLERAGRATRVAVTDQLHGCLAESLHRLLQAGFSRG
jgi:hypothetical protein